MTKQKNKHYTEEFKLIAVKLCLESGKSDAESTKKRLLASAKKKIKK